MSQQINLVLPALRPRFDWLALPLVSGVAVVGLLLIAILAVFTMLRMDSLKSREAEIASQLQIVQQQVQSLGQSLGARHGDATLDKKIEAARLAVTQRQEVLGVIAQGDVTKASTYSGLLLGFSRQIVEGVWLLGFGFADKDIEIHGRLIDPALLPTYISKLNNEPAFAGRRFAALDMKGVEPTDEGKPDSAPAALPKAKAPGRFTEFDLRTEQLAIPEKTR